MRTLSSGKQILEGRVYWYDSGASGTLGHHVYDIADNTPVSGEKIHDALQALNGKKIRVTIETLEE